MEGLLDYTHAAVAITVMAGPFAVFILIVFFIERDMKSWNEPNEKKRARFDRLNERLSSTTRRLRESTLRLQAKKDTKNQAEKKKV